MTSRTDDRLVDTNLRDDCLVRHVSPNRLLFLSRWKARPWSEPSVLPALGLAFGHFDFKLRASIVHGGLKLRRIAQAIQENQPAIRGPVKPPKLRCASAGGGLEGSPT